MTGVQTCALPILTRLSHGVASSITNLIDPASMLIGGGGGKLIGTDFGCNISYKSKPYLTIKYVDITNNKIINNRFIIPYGGPGGSRTRVQNTFLFASYSNNKVNLQSTTK